MNQTVDHGAEWYGSALRNKPASTEPLAGDAATQAHRRAVAFVLPGLLLAVVAFMMLEQSLRWMATSLARSSFTKAELQIDHLRDQPGKGGFAVDGRIVSSGELIHTTETLAVSVERLRELEAAGRIPGAREPVHYLPADAPWAFVDPAIRIRVQSPDIFATNALGWTIVNVSSPPAPCG
jgi:hypothetical protein